MEKIRWYDKNPDLNQVFEFLQKLDDATQDKIAKDIIQILINDFELNLDEEINNISKNYNYVCKRWYDNNIDLFSAFEIIKNFPDKLKSEVARKIFESIWLIYFEEDGMND